MVNSEKQRDKQFLIRKAILIGALTTIAYMIGYYVRKLLGQTAPSITAEGVLADTTLASLQSMYLIFYAVGQFINGTLGDYIPPKYMVGGGFVLAGIACVLFPAVNAVGVSFLCFGILGFSLSMLRGPMMKIITENNSPKAARIICLAFRFGSHFSTWITTLVVTLFAWREAFSISGLVLLATAAVFFLSVVGMQKADMVKEIAVAKENRKKLSLKEVFGVFLVPGFLFYFGISCTVEVANTCTIYYLPSYFSEALGMEAGVRNTVMSVISTLMASCSFLILPLLKLFRWRDHWLMRFAFLEIAICFLGVLLSKDVMWVNVGFVILAMLLVGCMGSLVWGVFIPSLGKTGKVSGANGTLDSFGYLVAALMQMVFSYAKGLLNGDGLIIAWILVPLIGAGIAFARKTPCVEE